MPSYTKEQREHALEVLRQCDGRVTQAITRLGYPPGQTMYQWIRGETAATVRTAGRPFSHYDADVKESASALLRAGVDAKLIARALGLSSAAVVYNWARPRKGGPPMRTRDAPGLPDGREPAWSGLGGTPEERARQPRPGNGVPGGVAGVLKADGPGPLTNREKALAVNRPGQTTDHTPREPAASLRISKSSYEYQRLAIAREDKYAGVRARVREAFEAVNASRGHGYVTHALRTGEDPIVVSEKAAGRIMREEGLRVCRKRAGKPYSSYRGEISDAPPNLVKRDFRSGLPNFLWLTDITEFSLPAGKACLSPVIDCFDGAVVSWNASTSPDADLANGMLEAACSTLAPGEHPVIHDDRGRRYRWPGWISICERHGLIRSMSAKGCSPDNSARGGLLYSLT